MNYFRSNPLDRDMYSDTQSQLNRRSNDDASFNDNLSIMERTSHLRSFFNEEKRQFKAENKRDNIERFLNGLQETNLRKYSKDPEIVFLVLCLKKAILDFYKRNDQLKIKNLAYEQENVELEMRLKILEQEEKQLQFEQSLLGDRPGDYINFDLGQLN